MSQSDPRAEEWKECIGQINKFDGYLIDLRKFGFSFVTGIATASSFLGIKQTSQELQLGVIIGNMVLVCVLYWIDQYYQNLLFGAVTRGRELEYIMGRALIERVSTINQRRGLSKFFGVGTIHVGFLIAITVLWTVSAWYQPDSPPPATTTPGNLAYRTVQVQPQDSGEQEERLRLLGLQNILISVLFATLVYVEVVHLTVESPRNKTYRAISEKIESYRSRKEQRKARLEAIPGELRDSWITIRELTAKEDWLINEASVKKKKDLDSQIQNLLKERNELEVRDSFPEEKQLESEIANIIEKNNSEGRWSKIF